MENDFIPEKHGRHFIKGNEVSTNSGQTDTIHPLGAKDVDR